MRKSTLRIGFVVAALAAVFGLAWWQGFLTPEPEAVSITEAAATVSAEAPGSGNFDDDGAAAESESTVEFLSGDWVVSPSDATFVGYRAERRVGQAVGRSSGVTGSLRASTSEIVEVTIVADMTTLESNSSVRDGHLGDQGFEHNIYPTSTFALNEPITVAELPTDGVETSFSAVGELTVRDITLPLTIELDVLIVDDKFIVADNSTIDLDAYGAAVSGTNEALMEFSVVFARS